MRGQGATEFLLIIAFILLLILPAGYYIFGQTQEASRLLQADLAVAELAKTADYIYYQAPGAKQLVTVYLPGGVDWAGSHIGHPTETGGPEINLALYTQTGGSTDVWEQVQGEVRGTWPDSNGNWRFTVQKMDDGYVLLSPYELTFLVSPASHSATLEPGNSTSYTLNVTEIGGEGRTVALTPQGEIATWISVASSLELAADSSNTTGVNITVPSGTASGLYEGSVVVSDGNISDSSYITIVVAGAAEPVYGFSGGLEVNIIEPENTTYYDLPINLTFTVNDTFDWCAYSIDNGTMLTIEGNTTLMPTNGSHHIFLRCVGEGGVTGANEEWFTASIGAEPWCYNLTMLWAFDSDYNDELSRVSQSDDVRADEVGIVRDKLSFIEATFALALSGDASQIVLYNMTEWVEHYEDDAQIIPALQWQLDTGWGATVCNLPTRVLSETVDSCSLSGEDVPETPGAVAKMSTRVFYLSQATTGRQGYIDWMAFEVCYGEAINRLDIDSPLNATYDTEDIWFNVSSNAVLAAAWYSLDGAANVTMTETDHSAYQQATVSEGAHTVQFWANDSNGNVVSNSTQFTVNITEDTTAPSITIESPLNQTYNESWVWMNVTLNENGDWAGYSLDGNANQTMSGSGTSWYYNASGLSNGSHYVVFYANDTSGNMGESGTVYFTINVPVTCVNLTLDSGYDEELEDETSDMVDSDDVRAEDSMTYNDDPGYLYGEFSGSISTGATIENATAYVEHYEDYSEFTNTLQWDSGGWGDVCTITRAASDTVDSCDLAGVDTVGEANSLDLRMEYTLPIIGRLTTRTAYIDQMRVEVCYTV